MGFDELYRTYADVVYGFLLFKLHNKELAEDLLQETFAAVYQDAEKLAGVDSLKAWLLTIARHKMIDHLRRERAGAEFLQMQQLATGLQEPQSALFAKEILQQLGDTEQTIIYGLYVEDLTCAQVAAWLAIPEGTVKSKAFYARKKLRRWLEEGEK